MGIQYDRFPRVSAELKDMEQDETGLYIQGQKTTAGAPVVTAGFFAAGCMIQNQADSEVYRNSGTTAAPAWTTV